MMESTTHKYPFIKNHAFFYFCFFLCPLLVSASSKSTNSFPKEAFPTKHGYLPISPTSTSSIFYAFYEAQNSTLLFSKTPLLIWLQGGPGCSSMIGNLYELGPWRVTESLTLQPNPGAWNRIFGLLFLDNPIGTGLSVASTRQEIPTDQNGIAKHLFAAITRFVQLDPLFKNRPIYITGESYAGKYVPAIGYYILEKNANLNVSERVNLAGVAIGDGLTDPETQVMGNWSEATDARNKVLKMLQSMTGLDTLYDYTRKTPYEDDLVEQFLSIAEVKKALGINESFAYESCSDVVGDVLHADVMKSVKYMVEYLLSRSKVLLYQGQHDLRDGVVQTEVWVKTVKWEGIVEFLNSERKIWKVNGELARKLKVPNQALSLTDLSLSTTTPPPSNPPSPPIPSTPLSPLLPTAPVTLPMPPPSVTPPSSGFATTSASSIMSASSPPTTPSLSSLSTALTPLTTASRHPASTRPAPTGSPSSLTLSQTSTAASRRAAPISSCASGSPRLCERSSPRRCILSLARERRGRNCWK
ncbi:Serine carboxypeptidase-like 50 [Glycine soja]|nr:Serine carboxypeptidase-like 50 [Glycine soja]